MVIASCLLRFLDPVYKPTVCSCLPGFPGWEANCRFLLTEYLFPVCEASCRFLLTEYLFPVCEANCSFLLTKYLVPVCEANCRFLLTEYLFPVCEANCRIWLLNTCFLFVKPTVGSCLLILISCLVSQL